MPNVKCLFLVLSMLALGVLGACSTPNIGTELAAFNKGVAATSSGYAQLRASEREARQGRNLQRLVPASTKIPPENKRAKLTGCVDIAEAEELLTVADESRKRGASGRDLISAYQEVVAKLRASKCHVKFPGSKRLVAEERGPKLALLVKAVSDYSSALETAASSQDIDELNANTEKLRASVTGLFGAVAVLATGPAGAASSALIDPVTKAARWLTLRYFEYKRYQVIKTAILDADEAIGRLNDLAIPIVTNLHVNAINFRHVNLRAHIQSKDDNVNRGALSRDSVPYRARTPIGQEVTNDEVILTKMLGGDPIKPFLSLKTAHGNLREAVETDSPEQVTRLLEQLGEFITIARAWQAATAQ